MEESYSCEDYCFDFKRICDELSSNVTNLFKTFQDTFEDLKDLELLSEEKLYEPLLKQIRAREKGLEKDVKKLDEYLHKEDNEISNMKAELEKNQKYLSNITDNLEKVKLEQNEREKSLKELEELKLRVKVCKLCTATNFQYIKPNVSGYIKGQKEGNYKVFNLDLPKLGQQEVTKKLNNLLNEIVKEDLRE